MRASARLARKITRIAMHRCRKYISCDMYHGSIV
jgi:hypothetical protein